ncbi:MAG: hypothetical protein ACRD50_16555 [Candidatus Acidiferrales bacterium]
MQGQRGYMLLTVIFLVALMIIAAAIAVPNIITEGKRQREAELIWRGEQYERAIGLYFKKTGHFPQTLDDLVKGMPGVRFLREPYKDPINTQDGSWRFIYVVPTTGQLIGSVRWANLQYMDIELHPLPGFGPGQTFPGLGGQPAGMGGSSAAGLSGGFGSGQGGTTPQNSPMPGNPGGNSSGVGTPSGQGGEGEGSSTQDSGGNSGQNSAPPQSPAPGSPFTQQGSNSVAPGLSGVPGQAGLPQPTGEVSGPVLGGFLIGVASKMDKSSLKVYEKGKTYKQWEFIWDPLAATRVSIPGGVSTGTPVQPGGAQSTPQPFPNSPMPPLNPLPPSQPPQ